MDGRDLGQELFEMGAAMNRAAAEGIDAVQEMLDAAQRNNPLWCPPGIVASLEMYRDRRVPTGGFLRAVLENDLLGAYERADGTNIRHIPGIVAWCYNELPSGAWGSAAKVTAWLTREAKEVGAG